MSTLLVKDLTLDGGPNQPDVKMPKLIYGTAWKKEKTADLTLLALKSGFRAIDTAAQPKHYREDLVGEGVRRAISERLVSRNDLFIQTKFSPVFAQHPHHAPYDPSSPLADQVHSSIASSLKNFTMPGDEEPYLDCVVLHGPYPTMDDNLAVWAALSSYVPHRIHHLGVSNAPAHVVEGLLSSTTSPVKPSVVQNRFGPATHFDVDLRHLCRDHGIKYQAFGILGLNRQILHDDSVLGPVVREAGVGAVVALYSLVLGLGDTAVLDGTTDPRHMGEDMAGFEKVRQWVGVGEGTEAFKRAMVAFHRAIGEVDTDDE